MFDLLYLHTGSGKTATSSIQGTLWQNQARLARHGVYFIKKPMGILTRVANDPHRLAPVRAAKMSDAFLAELQAEVAQDLAQAAEQPDLTTAVMSSEHMLVFGQDEVERLRDLLAPFAREIRILYYARHPYSKIASAYAQRVKAGHCGLDTSMAKFIEPFSEQTRHWTAVFGKSQMDVRKFELEDMPHGSPIADFCAAIGVPDVFAERDVSSANDGISTAAVLIADQLYQHFPAYSEGRGARDYLNDITGSKFTVAPEVIQQLQPRIDGEVAFLRDEFGLDLKEPPIKAHTDDRNVIFSDEVIASIALALNAQQLQLDRLRDKIRLKRRTLERLQKEVKDKADV